MTFDPHDPTAPAIPSRPARLEDDDAAGGYELVIDISHWDWDEDRGKLIDSETGLDLLVDGEPNPEIARRKGFVEP